VLTGTVSCGSGSASSGSCLTVIGAVLETVSVVSVGEVTASAVVADVEGSASVVAVAEASAVSAVVEVSAVVIVGAGAVGSGTSSEKGKYINNNLETVWHL
jgi:hypothetical protein